MLDLRTPPFPKDCLEPQEGATLELMDVDRAQRLVSHFEVNLRVEGVRLSQALGRIIGSTIRADADIVPYARSAMDGYAVRADDVLEAQWLPVRAEVFAKRGIQRHRAGSATAIATGAPIPYGADAVIPFERAERHAEAIRVANAVLAGDHIFPPGDDAKVGDMLIEAGQRLHPGGVSLLASAGIDQVPVVRRVRVAVLCTGDELVEPRETPAHGEIRNSNGPMLSSLIAETGSAVVQCRLVPDDPAAITAALEDALQEADLVITSGGASTGPRDFVKASLEHLATDFFFRSVAMRPGRPIAFGQCQGKLIAVLPGNPAAAFVGFVQIVRLALLRLSGLADTRLPRVLARLAGNDAKGKENRSSFIFARTVLAHDALERTVIPLDNQCSSVTRTAAAANSLIVLPPGSRRYQEGDLVSVDLLPWNSGQ